MTSQPSVGVVLEKIEKLRADIADIKELLKSQTDRLLSFEKESSNDRAVINEKISELQECVKDHDVRLGVVERIVQRLTLTDAIVRWVGIILMGSIITLIWGIIMHQVNVVIP